LKMSIITEAVGELYNDSYSQKFAAANGMASVADKMLGDAVAALKAKKMWDNTLLVHASDNGANYGSLGERLSDVLGNSYPLRGAKTSAFEGGFRVPAFVGGGRVPENRRGKTLDGLIHISDWYPTLLGLAGIPPEKENDMPPVDGVNLWPYLTDRHPGPVRTSLMLGVENLHGATAYINGSYKLLRQSWDSVVKNCMTQQWSGPIFPNSSIVQTREELADLHPDRRGGKCSGGFEMLFDIYADPSETQDLSTSVNHKELLSSMRKQMDDNNKSTTFGHLWAPMERKDQFERREAQQCKRSVKQHEGYHALFVEEDAEVLMTEVAQGIFVAEKSFAIRSNADQGLHVQELMRSLSDRNQSMGFGDEAPSREWLSARRYM